jgi:hypothetical protein
MGSGLAIALRPYHNRELILTGWTSRRNEKQPNLA